MVSEGISCPRSNCSICRSSCVSATELRCSRQSRRAGCSKSRWAMGSGTAAHVRHLKSGLKKRPVKTLAVKSDEYSPLRQSFRTSSRSEGSSLWSRMKYCSTTKPSSSHQPRPTRNAYVPVPPASPVVSVSRNTHLADVTDGFAGIGRNKPQRSGTHHCRARLGEMASAHGYGPRIGWSGFPHQADASIDRSLNCLCGLPGIRQPTADATPPHVKAFPQLHSLLTLEIRDLESGSNSRSKIASAASLARSPVSPAGPTHDGHPFSHGQPAMSSRVRRISNSWR